MTGLEEALREWTGTLRGENRAQAVRLMMALADIIQTFDREDRYGAIDSHGVTFGGERGVLNQRFKHLLNHTT